MTAEIIRLPYRVTRRAHSQKPRRSKNGTPAERTARMPPAAPVIALYRSPAAPAQKSNGRKVNDGNNPLRSKFLATSKTVTIVGKVIHRRKQFDVSTLSPAECREWIAELCRGADAARAIADEAAKAAYHLGARLLLL